LSSRAAGKRCGDLVFGREIATLPTVVRYDDLVWIPAAARNDIQGERITSYINNSGLHEIIIDNYFIIVYNGIYNN